ncbi:MAG: nitrilase, partial [Alphaproteobacteria bacterium]|nr:nitrilase [Alphaproteobacteria bacterium]
HILAGSGPVRTNDGAYVNAAQIVTPTGLVGEQEKLMMTPFERDWGISAGRTVRVFQTDLATLGVAICYDIEFPLIARAMATAGAELILVPSCTERVSGYHRVRTAARARALENTLATVQSPTVGDALWSPAIDINCGAAGIYVPAEHGISDTGVVADGTLNAPQWVTGSIDLIKLKALRTGGEMHNFDDWTRQPGANAAPANVEVIDLRSK